MAVSNGSEWEVNRRRPTPQLPRNGQSSGLRRCLAACVLAAAIHGPLNAWDWNPLPEISDASSRYVIRPTTAAAGAIKTGTVASWRSLQRTSKAAWQKTWKVLDPYPNDPWTADADSEGTTTTEFFRSPRP